jgi:hypothetical protein
MKKRIFKHWKTTLLGFVLAILTALQQDHVETKDVILAGAIAGLGAIAKDENDDVEK